MYYALVGKKTLVYKNLARYQPVDSSISYPIKADGSLCRKGAYEVW